MAKLAEERNDWFQEVPVIPHSLKGSQKLLIALWYLGNLECYRAISQRFGISMSTAHKCVMEVTTTLKDMSNSEINFPSRTEFDTISTKFSRYGFTGVIGAIDGCHITMKPPKLHKGDYINRKGTTSINLTAMCDADAVLRYINLGFTGKVHDSRVFSESMLKAKLDHGDIPNEYHFLGDSGYALHCNMMVPYTNYGDLSESHIIYNKRHSSTRMIIERTFGLLKSRWRKLNLLDCELQNVNKIVAACCVLHNITLRCGDLRAYLDCYNIPQYHPEHMLRIRTDDKVLKRDSIREMLYELHNNH